jgi:phospholipid transport system substrate-binding protein
MMRRFLILIFAFLAVPTVASAQTSPDAAREFVKDLSAQAVVVLSDQSMSLEAREARMRDIVAENVDFRTIGRFVLGDAWKDASNAERDEYLALFRAFLLETYARRFGGYSGQTLRIEEAKPHGEGNAVVQTTILQDGGEDIRVVWLVATVEGALKIRDIVLNGKSMALTQRSDFATIVRREQIGGLLQLLRLRVSKFSAQS